MKEIIKKLLREGLDDTLTYEEEHLGTEYGVYEIMIPIAYLDMKYYFQASPMHEILSNRVFIKKGSAGNKSISTKNIKVLKTFHLPEEENEMILFLNDLRTNK